MNTLTKRRKPDQVLRLQNEAASMFEDGASVLNISQELLISEPYVHMLLKRAGFTSRSTRDKVDNLSPEDKAALCQGIIVERKTLSWAQEVFHLSTNSIYRVLRKAMYDPTIRQAEFGRCVDEAIALYKEGRSLREIHRETGVPGTIIYNFLSVTGVIPKTKLRLLDEDEADADEDQSVFNPIP